MDNEKLFKDLVRDEGLKLKMYVDTEGKRTIGVGHNLEAKPISHRAAYVIAEDDIAEVVVGLDQHLPWWKTLDEPRQRVLANMAFNLGVMGLLEFKRTLAAIQIGNFTGAAAGMLASKWARQVGARAQRLAQVMATGEDV